eukprot:Opistho-1_new@50513
MTASAMDTVGGATAVFPASHAHAGDVVINMPSDDVVDKTTLVRQEEPSQPVQPEHAALEETKGGDLTEQQADDADTIPPTVTVLRKATGEEVYIVGTVHFSHKSCEDVAKTIRLVKPDVVVLELCHSRVSILAAPEDHVPDAEFSFSEVQRVLREGRGAMGVMQLLLYSLSAKLSKDLGITPGREFRGSCRGASSPRVSRGTGRPTHPGHAPANARVPVGLAEVEACVFDCAHADRLHGGGR